MGANMTQTIKAFREAESYDGPSLIIAYSHCINQGIDMTKGQDHAEARRRVPASGRSTATIPGSRPQGKNPFQLDAKEPDFAKIEPYMYSEVRFKSLVTADPDARGHASRQGEGLRRAQVEGVQVPEREDFLIER